MKAYPQSFILLLQQIAVGGLFALAATPFHEIERGFYRSTAGVLVVAALLALWGKFALLRNGSNAGWELGEWSDLILYAFFVLFLLVYFFTLWREYIWIRARAFTAALFLGLAALSSASFEFHKAGVLSVEVLLYPVSFLLSALLLGAATVGMLLGHWYLIDAGQSIEPFRRIFKFFVTVLIVQTVFLLILPLLLYVSGDPGTASGVELLWRNHLMLAVSRLLISQVGPLALSYMIWQTLKIPNTMAATGLFYITLLGVVVGEILGRQLLALTSLPL
ncbi:MAG: hypothetical protein GTO40_03980 [Deltaproteobacteria bacterium]|nr:hypothetical protein [Deltaproteobacteria bacterium]